MIDRCADSTQRTRRPQRNRRAIVCLCVLGVLGVRSLAAFAQEPTAPQPVAPAQLQAAIDTLGKLAYAIRANASRIVPRAPPAQPRPPLLQALPDHPARSGRSPAPALPT